MTTKTKAKPKVVARAEATMAAAALRGALKALAGVTERKNTIPILSHVMLTGAGKALHLHATDLDLYARATVATEEETGLATTISARTLSAIIAEVGGGTVAMSLEAGATRLSLVAGRASFELPVLHPDEFPKPPERVWDSEFSLSGADLVALLAPVAYAMSTEETRYYLNGVFLHRKRKHLFAAATDGHRLAVKKMVAPEGAQTLPDVIVPRKTIALILQLADRAVDPVTISACATAIRFEFDGIMIQTKLIDGTYPDYSRVIPTANDKEASVDPTALLAAGRRVTAITTEKTRAIKFECGRDRITAEVYSPENGKAREEVPASYDAAPMTIGFNWGYLTEILSRAGGDDIKLVMADAAAPTLIEDKSHPDLVQVLMPMRV